MGNRSVNEAVKCTEAEYYETVFDFGIVDLVSVPANLTPGEYVLSFRWDCEQTKQIWNSCADVIVKAPPSNNEALQTKPFSPQRGCTPCCPNGLCAKCKGCLNKKDGECADCWKPILWNGRTYWTARSANIQCLGEPGEILEAEDGGAGNWMPGNPIDKPWSPGCRKCWKDEGSCDFKLRELWVPSKIVRPDPEPGRSGIPAWVWLVIIIVSLLIVVTIGFFSACKPSGEGARTWQTQVDDPVANAHRVVSLEMEVS